MDEKKDISPYRMNQIMKTAADVTNTLINSRHLFNPTYRECEIVLELAGRAIERSKNE